MQYGIQVTIAIVVEKGAKQVTTSRRTQRQYFCELIAFREIEREFEREAHIVVSP